ncbi:citramalyl-CoA lyase, mitochondrial-like [Diadema antillarum]|uniref:citramalyl-CoA lyase, mitochondrial-like n=1 Tax=Diadema antillarum TaxID=105358 RepID=UPI003A8A9AFC
MCNLTLSSGFLGFSHRSLTLSHRLGLRASAIDDRWKYHYQSASAASAVVRLFGNESLRPSRRAMLYTIGDDRKSLADLAQMKVDCAVMECEDGVALDNKAEAREIVWQTLDSVPMPKIRDVAVRINSMDSGYGEEDLAVILQAKRLPDTIVLPKFDSAESIRWLVHHLKSSLAGRELTKALRILVYAETAVSMIRLPESISEAQDILRSEPFTLDAIVFGVEDYCSDIGATRSTEGLEVLYARQRVVTVAKAFGLQAIDMIPLDVEDNEAVRRSSEEGARMGFTGRQVLQPSLVDIIQCAYGPSPDRIKWATELLAAFEESTGKGQAFIFQGRRIHKPFLLQAMNILELAKMDKAM